MLKREMNIADYDAELWQAMEQEKVRQEEHIELIASENYTSPRVMQAQGSQLTNKYAEGYPGKRYYGGCEYVDIVEQLAIDRAKELFGADYANVQPHSGSQANFAVYTALLQPGDTVLGMNLAQGGHLTHGSPVNFSGKLYNIIPYGIDESGKIDYEDMAKQAKEHKPKMIIGGFSAYSGIVDWAKMREIADSIGAYLFVDMAHVAGMAVPGVDDIAMDHMRLIDVELQAQIGHVDFVDDLARQIEAIEEIARHVDPVHRLDGQADLGGAAKVIYLSPQGRQLTQQGVRELASEQALILIAGRYEGIDERFIEAHVDEEWSIGDYVLSGGELPAMVLIDAVTRLLPGALGHADSAEEDSFTDGLLDCPHYTRPEVYADKRVPSVLLSGNHEHIRRWRLQQSLGRTYERRADLLESRSLSGEEKKLLEEYIRQRDDS